MRKGRIERVLRALASWDMLSEHDAGQTIEQLVDNWEDTYPGGHVDADCLDSILDITVRREWISRILSDLS